MGSSCKKEKMRRFSDEQIRRLEVMFESDTKLEPKKKDEVAKELGLQPRQVAIWFQNRRARCKSKQLEIDYNLLLSSYNTLSSQFDSLQKQHHALLAQLEKLKSREKVGVKSEEENQCNIDQLETCTGGGGNRSSSTSGSSSSDEESDYTTKMEYDQVLKYIIPDTSTKAEALDILQGMDDENDPLFRTVVDSLLTTSSAEDWGTSLDSDDLIYQPTTNDTDTYQWLDFWR